MSETKIKLTLDTVDDAIKELQAYKELFLRKVELLGQRVAARIASYAASGFASAPVDVQTNGTTWRTAHASVSIDSQGDTKLIVATGSDVIWCEFGTGVYFNGGVGSSPHPLGQELGYTIGGYGKGNGASDSWTFRSAGGLVETHGTPASMPMYSAMRDCVEDIDAIIKEVFA